MLSQSIESKLGILQLVLGALLLGAAAAYFVAQVKRNFRNPHWWREILFTIIGTFFILGYIATAFYVTLVYFRGWNRLWVVLGLTFLFVFGCYVFRWMKYPGIFQGKTRGTRMLEVTAATLLVLCTPIIALLAALYLARFLKLDNLLVRIGLSFKYSLGQWVCTCPNVLAPIPQGAWGRIERIHVIAEGDRTTQPLGGIGTVVYSVQFQDGTMVDVPEQAICT
jgi:hypothetical protein